MLNGKNSNGYGAAGRKSVKFPGSRNKGWRLPKISNSELWGNKINERNTNSESKSEVADAVIHLLWSVDHREWPCVISSFGPSVEVDYTSLSGVSPLIQRSEDLVSGWKKFLPGFNKTQHLAGPVLVKVEGNIASAWCAITATHTLGKERWIVGGHYEFGLELKEQTWKIVRMKLETAYIDGNTDLRRIATERLEANQ